MDIIIGLIGAKKAGKTTAFNVASEHEGVVEITLAGKLKDVSSTVSGVPRSYFDDQNVKEKELDNPFFLTADNLRAIFKAYDITPDYDQFIRPHIGKLLLTPRQIAQYVGSEVLRAWDPDIHCDHAVRGKDFRIGVVTDMRFPNEYEYFHKRGGNFHLLYIQNTAAEIEASKDTHVSEAYLKDLAKKATKTINNNGTIKDYQAEVRNYIKEILK